MTLEQYKATLERERQEAKIAMLVQCAIHEDTREEIIDMVQACEINTEEPNHYRTMNSFLIHSTNIVATSHATMWVESELDMLNYTDDLDCTVVEKKVA